MTVRQSGPSLGASPVTVHFHNVPVGITSAPVPVTISNSGNQNLVVGTLSFSQNDDNAFAIQNDLASNATIIPGNSATFELTFTPAGTGTRYAQVSIPSNDPVQNPFLFQVTGDTNPKGDVNGDGRVNIVDVILCLRMALGLEPPDLARADMNADNFIDIRDVLQVLIIMLE
jgi:hypothetical protein